MILRIILWLTFPIWGLPFLIWGIVNLICKDNGW